MKAYRIEVPATSANLGPGFDCLGLAVNMTLTVESRPAAGFSLELAGEGADSLPRDASNLLVRSALSAMAETHPPRVAIRVANPIPLERGLGSSAAAAIAGLVLGHLMSGRPWSREEILAAATAIEGHADNAAAAIFGGLVVCGVDPPFALVEEWPAELRLCAVVPELRVSTEMARRALPEEIPFADAVATSTRLARLLSALRARRFDLLRQALADRLHQPYRLPLATGLTAALAAMSAHDESLGAWLSGSGPTLMAVTTGDAMAVGRAGVDRFAECGVVARYLELTVDRGGLRHWEVDPR